MTTAYDTTTTAPGFPVARETRATVVDLTGVDLDVFDALRDLPYTVATHIVTTDDDPAPCEGDTCTPDEPLDAEYLIHWRAHESRRTYQLPVCRGCLLIEVRKLHTRPDTDTDTLCVDLPLPAVTA